MNKRSCTHTSQFSAGDRVTWSHAPTGGYGFPVAVAAVVVRSSGVRATIRVAVRRRGVWCTENRNVSAARLVPRSHFVAEVDQAEGKQP